MDYDGYLMTDGRTDGIEEGLGGMKFVRARFINDIIIFLVT